jgi:hypothetical protein
MQKTVGPDITSVDLVGGIAQLDTGEWVTITNLYDMKGREVSNPLLGRRGVAGPDSEGRWYAFMIEAAEFEQRTTLQ